MKKMALSGIVVLMFAAISNFPAWAAEEVATPDIPSDYEDAAKWPFPHTESCMPAGKEYRSTAYARITEDKKSESVLTTSLDGTIFRYRHEKGNGGPDFITDFIKAERGWIRIDVLSEYEKTGELFGKYMSENGVAPEDYGAACAKIMRTGFGKFWDKIFKKLHEE